MLKKKAAAIILGAAVAYTGVAAVYGLGNEGETMAVTAQETGKGPQGRLTVESVDAAVAQIPDFSYENVADLAEASMPSIVAITNKSVQEVQSYFLGRNFQYESESAGSGIIVSQNDDELLICTNNHVVEGAAELTVSFIDETSSEAVVKGTDPDNDLAVVAVDLDDIDDETLSAIRVAVMGNSDEMRVGEQVVAIGNALGYGQSVTTGILSAKDRELSAWDGYQAVTYDSLLQTDAAINPGNSGGALFNMEGELIGINSVKASENSVEGMGYAIPITKAEPILEELMSRETRTPVDEEEAAYMGISGESVPTEVTTMYGIPEGIYVEVVGEGSPAEEAGLEQGDIITDFDGVSVKTMRDLQKRMQYYRGGETVEMTVQSSADGAYQEKTLSITLGLRSDYQN